MVGAFPEKSLYAGDTAVVLPGSNYNNADFCIGRTAAGVHIVGYVFETRRGLLISSSPIGDAPRPEPVVAVEGRVEWIYQSAPVGVTLPVKQSRPGITRPRRTRIVNWETDARGLLTKVTDNWKRLTGQSVSDLRAWGWINVVHTDDRPRAIDIWQDALKLKGAYSTTYRMRLAAHNYSEVLIQAEPLETRAGIRWVGSCEF